MPFDNLSPPEDIHPALWRASQLARAHTKCVDTGHPILSSQLPGGGWPTGSLIELLITQSGAGELRLLTPILAATGKRPVMLIQPPHAPNALALAAMGLHPSKVIWVQPDRSADALWATEQALRAGGFGAVLMWQSHVRAESLRRLNLAAQEGVSLFFMFRPLAAAQDASPAPLRIAIRPAQGGIQIEFLKRRGPNKESNLFLPLSPSFTPRHATLDRPISVPTTARSIRAELVD